MNVTLNDSMLSFPQSRISSGSNRSSSMAGPILKKRRKTDLISSAPSKRQAPAFTSQALVQPTLRCSLSKGIKGIGYLTPGDPLDIKPRVLAHDFAFDLAAPLGQRACTFTMWRHGFGGYADSNDGILSPALCDSDRTYDGVDVYTAIRDGTEFGTSLPYDATDYPSVLKASTSLWDLELASWNSNGSKLLYDVGTNSSSLPLSGAAPTFSTMLQFTNYLPSVDHNNGTPFPSAIANPAYTNQSRPPFMVNLGPGTISFACQNKVPTSAEIEFVVFQIRDVQSTALYAGTGKNFIEDHIDYSNLTSQARLNGPQLTTQSSGSGGKVYTAYDNVNDPDYKFLGVYPKYAKLRSPLIEKDRFKFVLDGGALKTVKFDLPAQIYDSEKNRTVSGDPFAYDNVPVDPPTTPPTTTVVFDPTFNACVNTQTYIIAVAVNGVVMPVFTYPTTNNTNTASSVDYNNLSVVDRQAAFSSVLFTGSYVEHPMPCLATPQLSVYDNRPMLCDTSVITLDTIPATDPSFALCSGLVATMPQPVSTGNTICYSQIGSSLLKHEPFD